MVTKRKDISTTRSLESVPCQEIVNRTVSILKQVYRVMYRKMIQAVVMACVGEQMNPNQGLLLELASRRIREILGEAAGLPGTSTTLTTSCGSSQGTAESG